ncbi:MAG: hypothetical protein ACK2TS_04290 [Anaerolineales bacterium]|jgi:hypothetical protein
MSENEKEVEILMFHNPEAVSRLTLWTNIIAWIVLVVSLITSISNGYNSLTSNWASILEPSIPAMMKVGFLAQIVQDAFTGVVFFLVLRGVSVGLNLLRDLFYGNIDEEFEEEDD